jgi:uncharacterized membrane protein YphA (DoxX/SURF4 family)
VLRFFSRSRFADGASGAGLLVLRVAAPIAAVDLLSARLSPFTSIIDIVVGVLVVATGLAVLVGFLTSASAALLAVTVCWFWLPVRFDPLHSTALPALVTANAIAIALLGPGAFSIDARLYGPREIVVTPDSREDHRHEYRS